MGAGAARAPRRSEALKPRPVRGAGMRAAWVAGALLLPVVAGAGVAEQRGDDWKGSLYVVERGQALSYWWEGVGCGFPMRCGLRADHVSLDGAEDPTGTVEWGFIAYAPLAAYVAFHLTIVAHGTPHEVVWQVVQRNCGGLFSGHVVMDGFGQPLAAGFAWSDKTGPGPDGEYECGPT